MSMLDRETLSKRTHMNKTISDSMPTGVFCGLSYIELTQIGRPCQEPVPPKLLNASAIVYAIAGSDWKRRCCLWIPP